MSETIDRLDIEIQAQASNAIAELDRLYDSLDRIANVLNASAGAFATAKSAIQGTSRAMRSLAKISLPNITTITQQLGELSQMDMSGSGLGATLANASNEFLVLEQTSTEAGHSMSLLTPIVDGIKTAFNGIIDVVKGVASGVGTAATFIVSNFTMIGRAATRLGHIRSMLTGILGPLIGFYGVRSLIYLAKDAVELSSDLTEVQNVVDHAFGAEGAQAIEDFVSTSKQEFGLAELAAKQYSSRFQAMGKSMGITADMVGKAHETLGNRMVESYRDTGDAMGAMAINLTKLTADMASFYNVEQDAIAQAMNAIYTGQTRPLRQYGIDLTQATLAEWAMKQGLDANFQSMTQAEKAMLRYQYILAQTNMVQGDFARTADTWANQIRLLKQNFQALGSTIGGVVINAFKPLISWLNSAMSSVIAFAETIANALGKIFGWTIRREVGGGGGAGTDDMTGGLDAVGDAADGAGKSLGGANEKAKELKRTLLGFDEINKLNEPTDSGSSGSGGSGGGSGGSGGGGGGGASGSDFSLVKTDTIFDQFDSDIQTLFGLGKKISGVLSDAMESIDWQSVYKKARAFGSGLAEFLNGLISPRLFSNIGITIAGAINTVLNAKDAFLNRFNFKNLGYSLAAGLNSFFETWDAGLSAKVFYKTINGIVDTIWTAADKTEWGFIGTKISTCVREALEGIEWKQKVYPAAEEFGSGLAEFLNGLFKPSTFSAIGTTVAESLNTALHFLDDFGKDFKWHNFGVSLGAGLKSFLGTFDWMLTAHNFQTFANGILTAASAAVSQPDWRQVGYDIRNALLSINWKQIFASVGDFIVKAINAVVDLAGGLFDFPKLAEGIKSIVKALTPAAKGFAEGFTDTFETLANIGGSVLEGIGTGIQAIADALDALPEGTLELFGRWLGEIVPWILLLSGAKGVLGIVSGLLGKFVTIGSEIAGAAAVAETTSTTGGFSVLLSTLGAEGIAGSLIGASVIFAKKMSELYDVLRGGNGKVEQEATAFSHLVTGLQEAGYNVDELEPTMFDLVNQLEDGSITAETFGSKAVKAFEDAGISGKDVDDVLNGLVGNGKLLDSQVDIIETTLNGLGDTIETTGSKLAALDGDPKEAIEAIRQSVEQAAGESDRYGTLWETKVLPAISDVDWKDDVEGAYNAVINAINENGLTGEIGNFEAAVREKLPEAWSIIENGSSNSASNVGDLRDEIRDLAKADASGLKSNVGGAFDDIGAKAEGASEKTGSFSGGVIGFVGGILGQTITMALMGKAYGDIGDKAEGAQTPIEGLQTAISDMVASIKTNAATAETDSKTLSDNVVETFSSTIRGGVNSVSSATKTGLVDPLTGTVQSDLGMHSPSTVMKGFGENTIQGFVNGITGKKSDVTTAVNGIVTAVKTSLNGLKTSASSIGSSIATNLKSGVNSVSMPDLGSKIVSAMGDYAKSGHSNPFYTYGARIAESFKSGLKSVAAELRYEPAGTTKVTAGGKTQTVAQWNAVWRAQGGFPNYGELFVANEAGPEMIGKMGTKNVVANNQQIAAGIESAVVNGMMKAASAGLFGNSDGTPVVLNATIKTPDGDVLARVVERAQARRNARYQLTTVY